MPTRRGAMNSRIQAGTQVDSQLFSTFQRSWQLTMTKPRYELKAVAPLVTTTNALPQRPVRGRHWKRRR
jgi:hypothetical protein